MDKSGFEIWESTTGGTTWVHVKDPRDPTGWRQKKVGGKGTQRIQITPEEREFNQELVPYENAQHDPFTNGLLVRIHPKQVERGTNELTDEQLVQLLQINDDAVFSETLEAIDSEVVLRRLLTVAGRHATLPRFQAVQELVDTRYHIGKTSRVVQELYDDDSKYAAADL